MVELKLYLYRAPQPTYSNVEMIIQNRKMVLLCQICQILSDLDAVSRRLFNSPFAFALKYSMYHCLAATTPMQYNRTNADDGLYT